MIPKKTLLKALLISASLTALNANGQVVMDALFSEADVQIDGKLNEEVWQKARVYPLNVVWRQGAQHHQLREGGNIRLAWDHHCLYLAAELEDDDVVAEDDRDDVHHYKSGDVIELFIRPPGNRYYWEIYGTPNARKTVFFFPGSSRVFLPSSVNRAMKVKVAAMVDGTLNQWRDKDLGWTLEMAVPLEGLTELGDMIGVASEPWRLLIARYNYSAYHQTLGAEISSTSPSFENANFHNLARWGSVRFLRGHPTK